ncbi:MAG: hypothetical protein KC736_00225 [Candidatus Moranbacteria bacterium]|nr:hypothetical protein [Candidatus Moranbacteria bacterium]
MDKSYVGIYTINPGDIVVTYLTGNVSQYIAEVVTTNPLQWFGPFRRWQ